MKISANEKVVDRRQLLKEGVAGVVALGLGPVLSGCSAKYTTTRALAAARPSKQALDRGLERGDLKLNRYKFLTEKIGGEYPYNSFSADEVRRIAREAEEVKQAIQDNIITFEQAKYFDTNTYFDTTITENDHLNTIFKVLKEGLENGLIDRSRVKQYIESPDLLTASSIARSVVVREISNEQAGELLAQTHEYFGRTPAADFPFEKRIFSQLRWQIDHQLPVVIANMKDKGKLDGEDADRITALLAKKRESFLSSARDAVTNSYKELREIAEIDYYRYL